MLDFTDAGYFAWKLHGKVKDFAFGLEAWVKGSLTFKFGWILFSNGWVMLDFTDAEYFAGKLHRKVRFFYFGLEA